MNNEFLDIDPNQLDTAWLAQPKLYHKYAVQLADARRDLDRAKSHLEIIDADLDKEIRLTPSEFGLEKITESVVERTITLQTRHQKADEDRIEAKHSVDVFEAAIWALDSKKKALENLVQLRLSDYYSEPRAPKGERGEAIRDMEKKAIRSKGRDK